METLEQFQASIHSRKMTTEELIDWIYELLGERVILKSRISELVERLIIQDMGSGKCHSTKYS